MMFLDFEEEDKHTTNTANAQEFPDDPANPEKRAELLAQNAEKTLDKTEKNNTKKAPQSPEKQFVLFTFYLDQVAKTGQGYDLYCAIDGKRNSDPKKITFYRDQNFELLIFLNRESSIYRTIQQSIQDLEQALESATKDSLRQKITRELARAKEDLSFLEKNMDTLPFYSINKIGNSMRVIGRMWKGEKRGQENLAAQVSLEQIFSGEDAGSKKVEFANLFARLAENIKGRHVVVD